MQGKPGDFVPLALFIAIPIAALTAAFVYFVRASSIPSDQPPLTERDAPTPIEQSRRIGYWISSIVLGLLYVVVGLPKITPLFLVDIIHDFEKWGYSEQFQYFIGATEFVSGIFLMIPRTSFYVAIYLSIVMVGAIYTHIASAIDPWYYALIPAFCLSFLAFVAYEDWYERRYAFG